jgi:hypothetical protein
VPRVVRGIARDVQYRSEVFSSGPSGQFGTSSTGTYTILTFRIERPGEQPVPVQMKSVRVEGSISDGDEVEIDAEQRPGKVLKTKRVINHTTGVPIVAGAPLYVKIIAVPVVLFVIAIFAFAAYQFLELS